MVLVMGKFVGEAGEGGEGEGARALKRDRANKRNEGSARECVRGVGGCV